MSIYLFDDIEEILNKVDDIGLWDLFEFLEEYYDKGLLALEHEYLSKIKRGGKHLTYEEVFGSNNGE